MRIVAMFRVSTERQADEGSSLDSQERIYHEMAQKQGWTTVATFRGCESATMAATDRRVLQQVLACIREQSPDGVYVHEQSRLTRGDELEVALLMRELRENQVKIIIRGVVRDLESIDEKFMLGIQSLVDRAESERIKERLMRGKKQRAMQGKKTSGPAPYGYENARPGMPGRGTLAVIEEEAVIVRKIFELAASGLGPQRIGLALDAIGARSPRGGGWGKTTIRNILANRAYLGVACSGVWVAEKGSRNFRLKHDNGKAIIVENAHPPIIDRQTWDAIHNRAKLPRTAKPRMLTGLLFVNGIRFGGDVSKDISFYRSPRGQHGAPWLLTETTDAAVWEAFASLASAPEFVERLMSEARDPHQQQIVEMEIEHLTDQLGKAERRLERLLELRLDGEIDKDAYQAKSAETKSTIESIGRELAEQKAKAASFDTSHATRVVRAVQMLLGGRTKLSRDQQRAVIRSIVRRVDVVAVSTGAKQKRGERGGYGATGGPRWAIQSISFRLALGSPGSAVGEPVEAGGVGAASADATPTFEPRRDGRLVTTSFDCDPQPAAGIDPTSDDGAGRLVTIESCCDPVTAAGRSSDGHKVTNL